MKITPVLFKVNGNVRGARNRAVALLAVVLSVGTMAAQSSSSSSTSGTSGSSPTTSSPSNSGNGAYPSADSSATTRDRTTSAGTASSGTAGSYSSADTTGSSSSSTELKRGDRRFITKAAESSMKEVALSQLAEERAANPQVKSFAQQMVSDHSKLNSDLMQLAARKGVSLEDSHHSGWLSGHRDSATRSADAAGVTPTNGSSTSGRTMSGTDMANTSGGATGVTATGTSGMSASSRDSDLTNDRHYKSLAKKTGADFDKEYVDMMVDDHESDVKLFEKAAKDAKDPEVRSFASEHLPTLQAHLQHIQGLNKAVAE